MTAAPKKPAPRRRPAAAARADDRAWSVLSLEVRPAVAPALADRIRERWNVEPVQLEKPGFDHAWIDLYFEDAAAALLAARAAEQWPGVLRAQTGSSRPRDWETFWRHHFKPWAIGRRLFVVPAWEKRTRTPAGRLAVIVNPGMSFGTGEHFTTRFCLESIDRLCDAPRPPASLLDIGTGSGILALAAARLGVRRVWATDNDELALVSARENAALNRLSRRVRFSVGDIASDPLPGPADAVCANLFSGLLMASAATIVRAARRWIVLSGIREFEADGVAEAFRHAGAAERVRDGDGEWCGLLLEKPAAGRR